MFYANILGTFGRMVGDLACNKLMTTQSLFDVNHQYFVIFLRSLFFFYIYQRRFGGAR